MNRVTYLGVDGGGTKTRFALIDADGRLLAEAELGTTYHPHVGLDGVRAILGEGVTAVLDAAGHHHVTGARHHGLGREVHRLLRRPALAIDGGAGHVVG